MKNFTPEERTKHKQAVKLRRMTDEQIYEYIEMIYKNAECIKSIEVGNAFVIDFINGIHPGSRFAPATIAKLKAYAVECGYTDGKEGIQNE